MQQMESRQGTALKSRDNGQIHKGERAAIAIDADESVAGNALGAGDDTCELSWREMVHRVEHHDQIEAAGLYLIEAESIQLPVDYSSRVDSNAVR